MLYQIDYEEEDSNSFSYLRYPNLILQNCNSPHIPFLCFGKRLVKKGEKQSYKKTNFINGWHIFYKLNNLPKDKYFVFKLSFYFNDFTLIT
ncbi:Hypothetical protein Ccan_17000 [Capnocytophaga canimorsus Cc5]|uniref:Uncharacterized protein n=1 Tax=Capnocytophaga canimorsus (strain 5) TaxID=860228 RepID=F9YS91_CAPCC|nr:Hypothetical protein Ccan_17000 [Capnocytophaga canimorsus Cc5]